MQLDLMHISMQFNDDPNQKRADFTKLFQRAAIRNVAWITGTESQEKVTREILGSAANRMGYRLWCQPTQDCWIAVKKDRIRKGWDTYWEKVIEAGAGVGIHGPRGVLAVEWDDVLGHITVIASHYLTRGAPGDPNEVFNLAMARAIGRYTEAQGARARLVFYGGDQNIQDRQFDTFLGEPLTSVWDELGKHENSGHGNIDVIASYDRDGRVSASYARVLDDNAFHLYTDHYLVEAGYKVERPKKLS